DTRQRDRHQTIEELVHAVAAQGYLAADRHAFAQLELGDRLLRLGDHRLLTGDLLHFGRRRLDALFVLGRVADAHVDDDLVEPWISAPVLAATRTFLPSRTSKRTRVGLPSAVAIATFDTCSGASLRSIPPCGLVCDGLRWRASTLIPDTITLPSLGIALTTSPVRPLSLPDRTTTLSPFLIFCAAITAPPAPAK